MSHHVHCTHTERRTERPISLSPPMFTTLTLAEIIIATRCYILRLKCTKFDFGWGIAPDPAGGANSTPQAP